ncbi:MAG: PhnD/SsuA/transferrin family substrate-binding protein, partial [Anaerolineales bacterium]
MSADYAGAFYPDLMTQWRDSARRLAQASGLQIIVQMGPATEAEHLAMLANGQAHLASAHPLGQLLGVQRCWLWIAGWSAGEGQGPARVMFVSRKDSGIVPGDEGQVLPQLEGKRPCYPDTSRMAWPPLEGYIVPAGILRLAEVAPGDPVILEGPQESSFGPNLETGVYLGDCDFAAVPADVDPAQWVTNWLPSEAERRGATFESWAQRMQVLFTTEPLIPPYGIVVSSAVPA